MRREGTPAELFACIDEQLESQSKGVGYETLLEGLKPSPDSTHDNKYVFIRPIPESKFSIRLFPGSISAAEYCLDFVDSKTGQPVNSPFEYELWSVPNPEAPWLTMSMTGKLKSIEQAFGINKSDILPGEEKYVLRDGQTCLLTRPDKKPVRFTVPIRLHDPVEDATLVDIIDLPQTVAP
ncbi:hypothetical protein BD414DRAFT_576670 [Trametes punicea]|nr:hypothetical protein BD414DRAFT_576670 [Trametes punicea]